MQSDLIPVDRNQCQAEKRSVTAFQLGGRPGLRRCENEPDWIATERKSGPDGLRGAMSLCESCRQVFVQKMGEEYADLASMDEQAGEGDSRE